MRGDSLALSILHVEVAHLAHRDLPAVRREAGEALFSVRASAVICGAATVGLIPVGDLVRFPLELSVPNVILFHCAVLAAAAIVTLPLFLGAYLLPRYAGFLVALVETRADASAGLWGAGLAAFAAQIERDPKLVAGTFKDAGLAYLSPSLTHVPVQDRVALLRNPDRLAAPKLRYFAIVIVAIWLFTFHQGDQVWDVALLAAVVALLQAVAVRMAFVSRGQVRPAPFRVALVAAGLLACQALPLISIEDLAYLSQDLTAALVEPGCFGRAEDANYVGDVRDALGAFWGHVGQACGGFAFVLAVAVSGLALSGLFHLARSRGRRSQAAAIGLPFVAALTSVAVSYSFFQKVFHGPLRSATSWFPLSDDGSPGGDGLVANGLEAVDRLLWSAAYAMQGPPLLGGLPWLRLALPQIVVILLAAVVLRPWRTEAPR